MLENTGFLQQSQHHFRWMRRRFNGTILLLLSSILMAESVNVQQPHPKYTQSMTNLHIQDQSCTYEDCRDSLETHSRRLQSLGVDEANSRDIGNVVELGFLDEDGSMSGAYLMVWNDSYVDMELVPPVVESTIADLNHARFVPQEEVKDVIQCKESMQDLIPSRQEKRRESCVVMVPSHYVRQYKWPISQLKVANSFHPSFLCCHMQYLKGGPMYPNGAESYLDHLIQLVPELGIGTTTRVALDVECGTGSLSRVLGHRGVTTLCLDSYESLENGVQLVMERGFPGLLTHSFSSRIRLPFPSQAFDLLHCAACNISWPSCDGALLFEADRILRHGGFFVWIMDVPNQQATWSEMLIQASKLCWKLVTWDHQLAVWQKPANLTSMSCNHLTQVLISSSTRSYMESCNEPCLETTGKSMFMVKGNWTSRLINPPERLVIVPAAGIQRAKEEVLLSDFNYWVYLTDFYVCTFGPTRMAEIRNVLDANAGYESFAAALASRTPAVPWWVLNVVPVDHSDRLPVVFYRGLLGLYHDWYGLSTVTLQITPYLL